MRVAPPRADDPGYIPFLTELVEAHHVSAVIPLTDLDLEVLARSDLPAFVPEAEVCRATFDKYLAHQLLESHGLPSPPTWLPGEQAHGYPAVVKPRQGSGSRSIHPCADEREAEFFAGYVKEPVMVQRFMDGPEFSVDLLCNRDGVCLNAIPRTMLESRGGESIKGAAIADPELIDLGRAVAEALPLRGPATVQMFRDSELGLRVTDINARFGGAFACPMYAALEGPQLPRADRADGAGRDDRAARGRVPRGPHVHPLLLAARARRAVHADRARHRPGRPAPAALNLKGSDPFRFPRQL